MALLDPKMDIEYVDIWTGRNFRQFRLLIWTSFIGQFGDKIRVEDMW